MSHFVCIVIGEDAKAQLAPYDENITVEPYEELYDGESLQRMAAHYMIDPNNLPALAEQFPEWAGCNAVVRDGKLYRISTYNPKSKWDWYQLGGRWAGMLKLKAPGQAVQGERSWANEHETTDEMHGDAALKCDIDFDGMRDEAAEKAQARWERAQLILKGKSFDSWQTVFDRCGRDVEKARLEYHAQEGVKLLKEDKEFAWECDDILTSLPEYIARARMQAVSSFALLVNGEWYERGEMGWFGMASNEKDEDDWYKFVAQQLNAASETTPIAVYDLHI